MALTLGNSSAMLSSSKILSPDGMTQPTLKLSHSQIVLKQKLQFLQDKKRADLISYDDDLVRHENHALKHDLRVVKSIKTIKPKQEEKKPMRRGMTKGAHSVSQHQIQADPFDLMMGTHPAHPGSHHLGASMHQHQHQSSALPEIRRKGTYYHRKFLEDVRPRDYKVYLNSLKSLHQYRADETENKKLKQKLFREKMRLQNHIFQQHSKAAWGKVQQLAELQKAKSMEPKKTTEVKPAPTEVKKPIEKPGNPQAPAMPQGGVSLPGNTSNLPGAPGNTAGAGGLPAGTGLPGKPAVPANPMQGGASVPANPMQGGASQPANPAKPATNPATTNPTATNPAQSGTGAQKPAGGKSPGEAAPKK